MLEAVGQPAATDGTDHRAEVEHQHEGQGGAEAVTGLGHQLGQPGAERIHHEQAHEEGDPEHHGAEAAAVQEQLADRRAFDLLGAGQLEAVGGGGV